MNYNRDIMDWDEFPEYDWLWTDPPWGQGMVKMFQTIMKRDSGKVANNSLDGILNKLGSLARTNKPMVIEYSVRGHEQVRQIMFRHGHTRGSVHEAVQTNGKPFVIMVFNTLEEVATQYVGGRMIYETFHVLVPGIVFDPFAGIGKTAKSFRITGWKYIGSEINPARFVKLSKANP